MYMDLIKKRYSVRKFKDTKVEKEQLEGILEAGNIAPTGANKQPYRVLVVESEVGLLKIGEHANIYKAPLALIVCSCNQEAWERKNYDHKNLAEIDATIVTDHMMLEATDLGLGSLWVCHFNPQGIKTAFNIPDHLEPLHILAIGYANVNPASPERHKSVRKGLDKTVIYESF